MERRATSAVLRAAATSLASDLAPSVTSSGVGQAAQSVASALPSSVRNQLAAQFGGCESLKTIFFFS